MLPKRGKKPMEFEDKNISMSDQASKDVGEKLTTKTLEPMKLTYAGETKDILRSGGGKTSVTLADAGDTNKPKGQG
jgi:hypothetical protein